MVKWGMGREGGQPRTCVSKRGHGLGITNIHDAPRTRPAPAWIVRLLVGTAAEYRRAGIRSRKERAHRRAAPCAVLDRTGNARREVSRVHGSRTARRDVGPNPPADLPYPLPVVVAAPAVAGAQGIPGCTRESEKPRLRFGPSKRRERRWKWRYTHTHARAIACMAPRPPRRQRAQRCANCA